MMSHGIAPIVGDGNHPEVSLIYVMDLIQALLKSAELEEPGVRTYFVTGDRIANWSEIREIVTTVLGKRNIPLRLKPRLVKRIAGCVDTSASLLVIFPATSRHT